MVHCLTVDAGLVSDVLCCLAALKSDCLEQDDSNDSVASDVDEIFAAPEDAVSDDDVAADAVIAVDDVAAAKTPDVDAVVDDDVAAAETADVATANVDADVSDDKDEATCEILLAKALMVDAGSTAEDVLETEAASEVCSKDFWRALTFCSALTARAAW